MKTAGDRRARTETGAPPLHARAGFRSAVATGAADIGWLLIMVVLLPLWGALLLGAVVVLGTRQIYWWLRGNTSASSRPHNSAVPEPLLPRWTGARRAGLDTPSMPATLVDQARIVMASGPR